MFFREFLKSCLPWKYGFHLANQMRLNKIRINRAGRKKLYYKHRNCRKERKKKKIIE